MCMSKKFLFIVFFFMVVYACNKEALQQLF